MRLPRPKSNKHRTVGKKHVKRLICYTNQHGYCCCGKLVSEFFGEGLLVEGGYH